MYTLDVLARDVYRQRCAAQPDGAGGVDLSVHVGARNIAGYGKLPKGPVPVTVTGNHFGGLATLPSSGRSSRRPCCHVLVGAVVAAFGIVNSSALGQCQANEWVVLTDSKCPDAGAFGISIAIDGGTAVIGDVFDDDNGVNAGAAYVFQFDGSNWVQQQKLLAADGAASDIFGGTVAISGDIIVIGARGDDDNGNYSGSAYVFRFDPDTSNWIQEQKLLPDDGHFSDYFGISVQAPAPPDQRFAPCAVRAAPP